MRLLARSARRFSDFVPATGAGQEDALESVERGDEPALAARLQLLDRPRDLGQGGLRIALDLGDGGGVNARELSE